MPKPNPIAKALPLLRLGQDVHCLYLARFPSKFREFPVEEDAATIKKRIPRRIPAAERFLAEAPTSIAIPDDTPNRRKARTLAIALVAYGSFSAVYWHRTADGVAGTVGAALAADELAGALRARQAVAELLLSGPLTIDGEQVRLSDALLDYISGGNMVLTPGLTETELRQQLIQRESSSKAEQAAIKGIEGFTKYIKSIPVLTPAEMDDEIVKCSYVGQEQVRRSFCLSAYRHVQRLRRLFLMGVKSELLPERENLLLWGPTGCGKTHLVELLFGLLKIPTVVTDLTCYSETGYVGQSVESICTRLIHASRGSVPIAQTGIVLMDEIDKIAGVGGNSTMFGGERSNKDVSGMGVQRGLLKLLEPSVVEVPLRLGALAGGRDKTVPFRTRDVLWIGAGAFSGFDRLLKDQTPIGFRERQDGRALGGIDPTNAQAFHRYGIQPELFGRFGCVLRFEDLSREQLRNILEQTTIRRYTNELALDNIQLDVSPGVASLLVDQCMARGTGARGLAASMVGILNNALFDLYSTKRQGRKLVLYVEDGMVRWEVRSAPAWSGTSRQAKAQAKRNGRRAERVTSTRASGDL